MNSVLSLSGRVAIVTGASSGIGRACAVQLSELGAKVLLVGRDRQYLEQTATLCSEQTAVHLADFLHLDQVDTVVPKAVESFGQLDILVNSAGMVSKDTSENVDIKVFMECLQVNVTAAAALIKSATPYLKSSSSASVVNISSVYGVRPTSQRCSYSVSKAALDQLTRCAALDLAQYSIRVNSVNPGGTTGTRILRDTGLTEEQQHQLLESSAGSKHPLGKRCAQPEEIARTVAFLVSPAASFITGVTLPVDGGRLQLEGSL